MNAQDYLEEWASKNVEQAMKLEKEPELLVKKANLPLTGKPKSQKSQKSKKSKKSTKRR